MIVTKREIKYLFLYLLVKVNELIVNFSSLVYPSYPEFHTSDTGYMN